MLMIFLIFWNFEITFKNIENLKIFSISFDLTLIRIEQLNNIQQRNKTVCWDKKNLLNDERSF